MSLFRRAGRPGRGAPVAGTAATVPPASEDDRGCRVHGEVATRDGWPAPGAVVTVLDDTGSQVARAVTGPGGQFAADLPATGTVTVLVTGTGAAPLVVSAAVGPDGLDLGRLVAAGTTPDAARPPAGAWAIDPGHSVVRATARHLGMSRIEGRFTDLAGVVTVADPPEASSVEVAITAASITTGNADRDSHLRSADFLDVERFPELRFSSTAVRVTGPSTLDVEGSLTIRDVTRPVTLATEVTGSGPDPWGGTRLALVARTELARRDYAMAWDMGLPGGLSLVGPTLRVDLDVQAVRQP